MTTPLQRGGSRLPRYDITLSVPRTKEIRGPGRCWEAVLTTERSL